MKMLFPNDVARLPGLSISEIIHQYIYPFDNPMRELWFIVTLFWFFLITPVWETILKCRRNICLALIVLVILHFWHPETELLCIGRFFDYAIWFYLGVLISKEEVVDKIFNRTLKSSFLTLLSGIIIYCIGLVISPFITTIGGIFLSLGLALLLDRFIPKIFFSFRDFTYQIFLIGIFAQMMIKVMYRHFELPYVLAFIICTLAGVYVPVVFSKLLERIDWKPLLLCVGLKKRQIK